MSMGFGVLLFVLGAVAAFALDVDLGWIDIKTAGYILMGAGFVVFMIGLALMFRRRQATSTSRTTIDPASGERITRRDTSIPDDPTV